MPALTLNSTSVHLKKNQCCLRSFYIPCKKEPGFSSFSNLSELAELVAHWLCPVTKREFSTQVHVVHLCLLLLGFCLNFSMTSLVRGLFFWTRAQDIKGHRAEGTQTPTRELFILTMVSNI